MTDYTFLKINNEQFNVVSISELDLLLEKFANKNFVEYDIYGHGETGVSMLMNTVYSMGIYFRFSGDSGFTTYNPDGIGEPQDFVLSNGQKDEYPVNICVSKQLGFDILRHYFLTGEKYDHIEWREE